MANSTPHPAPFGDSYAFVANALVIAEHGEGLRAAGEALTLAGVRLTGEARFAEAAAQLAEQVTTDLILIEAVGAPEALLDSVLARADATARERGAAVVAAIGEDQIDVAAAHLLGRNCQLLCMPSMAERVTALAVAKQRLTGRLNDTSRDAETERLQRLNEEVARIADTLARLTRSETTERRKGVRAPGPDYRGPSDGEGPQPSAQEIRATIRSRRLRAQFFAGELFADPAWDMLLDLFAAELERRQVSVSSLCIAAAVPPTTALRWIGTLHDAGLFERHADPSDRRRAYIALSAKGLDGMRNYVAAAKRQGLSIV
ncbi:MAG: winged helix DNA-binding protein [Pseudomonadota bacterium]